MELRKKNRTFSMDIAREICTDSFYTVNSGLPRVPLTAVTWYYTGCQIITQLSVNFLRSIWKKFTPGKKIYTSTACGACDKSKVCSKVLFMSIYIAKKPPEVLDQRLSIPNTPTNLNMGLTAPPPVWTMLKKIHFWLMKASLIQKAFQTPRFFCSCWAASWL